MPPARKSCWSCVQPYLCNAGNALHRWGKSNGERRQVLGVTECLATRIVITTWEEKNQYWHFTNVKPAAKENQVLRPATLPRNVMRLWIFCKRNGGGGGIYLAFSSSLSILLIPDIMRVYKSKSSWVRRGRLGRWPKNCNLQNKFVGSGYMCIFCGSFGSAFASSVFKLKLDTFVNYVQFTLGICISLDKIISNDPQILFWVPLQSKPKLYVFAKSVNRGWPYCIFV